MKVLKIVKKYKAILLIIAIVAAVFAGYSGLHDIATGVRGYEAVGGEIFVFILPFLIYVTVCNFKDTVNVYKNK